jgi:Tfp pilus assembly protein PilE
MTTDRRTLQRGFTVLELMLMVAITAALVGLILPKFIGVDNLAKEHQAQSELKFLQSGVVSYYLNSKPHVYPPTTTTVAASYLTAASPNVVQSVLYDPFGATTTTEYNFLRSSNAKYYVIYSRGPAKDGVVTSVSDAGTAVKTNNPMCVTNGTGCAISGSGGVVDDSCLGCSGGKFCCSGSCVDRGSDMNNCGACGTVCVTSCVNGVCI